MSALEIVVVDEDCGCDITAVKKLPEPRPDRALSDLCFLRFTFEGSGVVDEGKQYHAAGKLEHTSKFEYYDNHK